MSTDNTELLSKFLNEYNQLKKQNQEYQMKENSTYQSLINENQLLVQELNRIKKENQRLIDNNTFLTDQLNQLKELYQETKQELQESFNFIQTINKTMKTGTFEHDDRDINKLMEIFSVNSMEQLLTTAEKIKTVMLGVAHLESFCRQICEIIYDQNEEQYNLEQVFPIIQKWKFDSKYVDCFLNFKNQLEQTLSLKQSTDSQIIDAIKSLQNTSNNDIQTIKSLFKIDSSDNLMFKMNQTFILLQDIQQFIKIAKRLLDLDENMKSEACMIYILKIIEKIKQNQFNDPDLILKIMKTLKVDHPSQILAKLESCTN
ncbi:unnamed protein product (macronuclear) [Paramecium tetraurelia]|uniref:Uncharacterized protein n=1 Tax=Paramecium tetraurelia TaxID=5888 RepID=A0C3V0_PARTE|nr:uncharacterized protein GSPATT00034946001 [Paramecium tetraurelia]CAK65467.1 unnamed protein product [Paramecium tetraurelia]|eukprot:XP_001432864.1 hypothetical protein (macronuclear) [Paramecium tetraurelia strain d4-2]